MSSPKPSPEEQAGLTRRDLGALAAGVLAAAPHLAAQTSARAAAGNSDPVLEIADWSYHWYGVEHATLARGTVCNGMQMYVEHWIPAQVRHPYPVVLIHGGYRQGLDWISTPDGRRGWASLLLEQGYKVYVVDRPGQGRNPYHPWVHGPYDRQAPTFESAARAVAGNGGLHTKWPGSGEARDPAVVQFTAAMKQPMAPNSLTRDLWRSRGVMLLEDIGPAILLTHGDGSMFAWVTAAARPDLVKGIAVVEQSAQSLNGLSPAELAQLAKTPISIVTAEASPSNNSDAAIARSLRDAGCAVALIRLTDHNVHGNGPMVIVEKNNREALQPILDWMDSSVNKGASAGQLPDPHPNKESTALKLADQGCFFVGVQRKTMSYGEIALGQMYVQYMIPAEKRYPYPIVMVHGGGGQGTHMMGIGGRPGFVHYFVQAGYSVYWVDRPSFGRSPYHPDALGPSHLPTVPAIEFLLTSTAVFNTAQWPGPGGMHDPLVDQFMACERGNVSDEAFHSALVWPGGAELLERLGPSVLFVHAFGGFFAWGVADRRPDLVKGIVCMEINGNPFERQLVWGLTAGPISYDPPVSKLSDFQFVQHTEPPDSPRPIDSPYHLQAEPAHLWKNLKGIPVSWVTSEFGGGGSPVANVAFLQQVGCSAEMLRLRDSGVFGNGNLMLMEKNNHEVFGVIRDWLDRKVASRRA